MPTRLAILRCKGSSNPVKMRPGLEQWIAGGQTAAAGPAAQAAAAGGLAVACNNGIVQGYAAGMECCPRYLDLG